MSTLLPNCHNSDLQFRKTHRYSDDVRWQGRTLEWLDLKWSHKMEYYYSWDHFKSLSASDLVIVAISVVFLYTGRSPVMYNLPAGNYHLQVFPQECGRKRRSSLSSLISRNKHPHYFGGFFLVVECISNYILGTRDYCCSFEFMQSKWWSE